MAKYQFIVDTHLPDAPRFFPHALAEKIKEEFWEKACTEEELLDGKHEKIAYFAQQLWFDDSHWVEEMISDYTLSRAMSLYVERWGSFDDLIKSFPKDRWVASDEKIYVSLLTVIIDEAVTVGYFDYDRWKAEKEEEDRRELEHKIEIEREREAEARKKEEKAKTLKSKTAKYKPRPGDWEMDVPPEAVGDVMKMFEKMAAGGAPVFFNKDFKP